MEIEAAKGWVNTGYKPGAQSGVYVNVHADGEWCCRTDDRPYGMRNADGGRNNTGAYNIENVEGNTWFPYSGPGARMGMLVGKLGPNGQPFLMGKTKSLAISQISPDLELYVRINFGDLAICDGALNLRIKVSDGQPDKEREWVFSRVAQRWVQQ
ncbi:hypothetical protein FNU76_18800 [Chitinimonas arctica]|uniref:Uncharacterized protein n=1 Tax=Chitinimonas arctica TaxID=2594795 RepID=A0A516SJA5_9NEIS|nr:hypothetical protein [Chitinimonas arctica]QDQ28230.1 hypothetical protein FNU76_18800 [Chitinimonas arctica]